MLTSAQVVRSLHLSVLGAASIGGLVLSGGCSSGGMTKYQTTYAPTAPALASADAGFLEAAERSSGWAVHMSDLVIANGSRAEVKAAATTIRQRETANLAMLAKARTSLGMPAQASDHHTDSHMAMDEERLAAATGDDADMLYVQHMMEQRREMITLANFAAPQLRHPRLMALARALPDERNLELAELRRVQHAAKPVPTNSRAALGIKSGPTTPATQPRR